MLERVRWRVGGMESKRGDGLKWGWEVKYVEQVSELNAGRYNAVRL